MRFDPVGGMANQLRQLSAALAARGHRETVLTLGNDASPRRLLTSPNTDVRATRVPWPPIRSELSGTYGLVYSWALAVAARLVADRRRLQREYDLVHVHFDGTLAPPLVLRVAKRCTSLPVVATLNCCRGATLHEAAADRARADWSDALELAALREADAVQTITERTRDYLVRRGVAPAKVTTIGDMVDTAVFASDAQASRDLRRRYGVPEDANVVVFASRISWEKGWEYFLDAASLMRDRPEYRFVITSGGLQQPRLERRAASLGLRNLIVTGYLEHAEMPAALSMGNVFVFPSKYEELGSTILEAMALEIPVIGARVGGIPEVLDHGRAGVVVEPHSGRAIVEAVERLTADAALRTSLTERAKRRIAARYDKAVVVPDVERLYASVVSQRRPH